QKTSLPCTTKMAKEAVILTVPGILLHITICVQGVGMVGVPFRIITTNFRRLMKEGASITNTLPIRPPIGPKDSIVKMWASLPGNNTTGVLTNRLWLVIQPRRHCFSRRSEERRVGKECRRRRGA